MKKILCLCISMLFLLTACNMQEQQSEGYHLNVIE